MLLNYVPPQNQEPHRQTQSGTSDHHNTKPPDPASIAFVTSDLTGVSFAQLGNAVAGSDGVTLSHITYFTCNSKGHYASVCPAAVGTTNLHATVEEAAVSDIRDGDVDSDS